MTTPTIPPYLREPVRKGFTESPMNTWQENATQMGPAIRVSLYDNAPTVFKVTWTLDEIEFYAFDSWFKRDLNQGQKSFIIPLLTGMGIVDHECFFSGKNPTYTLNNKKVTVKAILEARFKKYDTDENINETLSGLESLYNAGDKRPSETLSEFSAFMTHTLPNLWSNF